MADNINRHVLSWLLGGLGFDFPANHWLGILIAALIHCVLVLHVVAVGALVFIWMERKIAGRIQDRLGPTRVGGKFGWLQTLADGLKLITKEDLMPGAADRCSSSWLPISVCPPVIRRTLPCRSRRAGLVAK